MLVIFLYMEVLLISNKKVPCWACKGTKLTSYKNAQHQNQLKCWSTKAVILFVFITRFLIVLNEPNKAITYAQTLIKNCQMVNRGIRKLKIEMAK